MEFQGIGDLMAARPPRIEDAGLEDCALPAQAIQEAFKRAAEALRTTASGALGISEIPHEEFAKNPGPTNGIWEDECLDTSELGHLGQFGEKQSCVSLKKGGLIEEGYDLLVQDGSHGTGDKLVVGTESGPKLGDDSCVDGLTVDDPKVENSPGPSEGAPIVV